MGRVVRRVHGREIRKTHRCGDQIYVKFERDGRGPTDVIMSFEAYLRDVQKIDTNEDGVRESPSSGDTYVNKVIQEEIDPIYFWLALGLGLLTLLFLVSFLFT